MVQTNQGTASANSGVPGGQNPGTNPTTGAGPAKDGDGNTTAPAPSSDATPASPTGDFVSNHSPNLSGQPAPNTETSTCITTPGVYCQIRFAKGGITKQLPRQKTDGSGSTIWDNWTLQSIGLTQGTWQVTAVATNGSKTVTAQDSIHLIVGP